MDDRDAPNPRTAVWILGELRYSTPAGDADVSRLRGRQPQIVLARLAASPGMLVAVNDIAETLWGDQRPGGSWTTLRSIVSRLRHALSTAGWPSTDPLRAAQDAYVLTADGRVWVDASFARHAVSTAEARLAIADHLGAATAGEAAWQLARRPPVLSSDTRFGARFARGVTRTAHRAAMVTARAWLAAGDPEFAAHFAREAIDVAPYREDGWRVLLEAHGGRQDLAAVAATFEEMITLLDADLGVSPHPESFRLYRHLVDAVHLSASPFVRAASSRK